MSRFFFFIAALLAGLSVAMGAYSAHSDVFDEVQLLWVDKGVRYQMYHALAMLITSLAMQNKRKTYLLLIFANLCFLSGILLFSGSLYVMAISSLDAGYITPTGGILFLAGWLLLAIGGPGAASKR
ncbi:MAG: DUF423 domain-containing protein [Desulfobulbaceae bacterium]|nr:MAG: DUF423 domain-containing protein [Desulfobulbaceae bacterium]